MSTHNICFCGEIRKNMWIPPLICSYVIILKKNELLWRPNTQDKYCNICLGSYFQIQPRKNLKKEKRKQQEGRVLTKQLNQRSKQQINLQKMKMKIRFHCLRQVKQMVPQKRWKQTQESNRKLRSQGTKAHGKMLRSIPDSAPFVRCHILLWALCSHQIGTFLNV